MNLLTGVRSLMNSTNSSQGIFSSVLSVIFLAFVYLDMTSFAVHLDKKLQILSWEERLQIALDISHGIAYLHDGVG